MPNKFKAAIKKIGVPRKVAGAPAATPARPVSPAVTGNAPGAPVAAPASPKKAETRLKPGELEPFSKERGLIGKALAKKPAKEGSPTVKTEPTPPAGGAKALINGRTYVVGDVVLDGPWKGQKVLSIDDGIPVLSKGTPKKLVGKGYGEK